ncbi:putative antibiotic biosynthesis monooxygenase [Candidatus Protochlamydia naegleriophila]|uniref:Putative antibiotic biosynthesis monooxygenase n=2 Tax=Candidatus Protochlamydia naegleriophila TaxID=389348 RepID=A0A0U5CP27_9BACT|nr:putative antibiotic biosynthesis monooxygenase [Candidatus Protochlamydia naegleriophila]
MLTVIAKITARQDQVLATKEVLENLVASTLKEEGCRSYELYESIEEKNVFIFHEEWESKELLDRHLASKHIADFVERSHELLAKPVEIDLLKKV